MDNPRALDADDDDHDNGDGDPIPELVDMSDLNAQPAHSLVFESVSFAPLPLPDPDGATVPAATSALARRRRLREMNSEVVRDLVHATGKSHAQVNAVLNKKVGLKRITEASVFQLERRLKMAKAILQSPRQGRPLF
jgi:hypothetical protein